MIAVVLPQLWGGIYAMPMLAAREALLTFLEGFTEMVEIVTDAPQYDWELFCELAYREEHWAGNVRNMPIDATTLEALNDGEPLPHHTLLDARIIVSMFTLRCSTSALSTWKCKTELPLFTTELLLLP